jgi:PAS domain S-box-containing protein
VKTNNQSLKSNPEDNFRGFFNNNIDFLFILDMEGNIIEINNAVKQILGYSDEDLIGKNVLLVHPPEFREEAANTVMKMIKGETSSCPIPVLTKNNEYIPVETRVFPGIWNSKDALIGVSRNLTELKLSEEKFSHVFNISPVLMSISTIDTGIFININNKFLTTLGYTKNELLGKTSKELDIFYDYEERQKAIDIFKKDKKLDNYEVLLKTKTGNLLYCLFSIDIIKIQTHEYLLTSAIDITQLKKAEARNRYLFEQQKLLADISQLLNDHKILRTNLVNVIGIIGKHTKVSRVYIFEDNNEGSTTRNTFEWCNSAIESQISNLQEVSYDIIPSWKKLLLKNGMIISNNISELPEDIQRGLELQGIKSILIYPLFVENIFFGFIGFDECIANKIWTDDEIDLLKLVSNNISNAFERMIVNDRLENSKLRLNLALESAKEGLWDWNVETGHVFFSDIWCTMLGYRPDEIEQHVSSWEKLVHPDDMPVIMETLNKHLNGDTEYYETIHRVKTKDGSWKWILDHGMVIQRDLENKPLRAIGVHTDITKQKEVEQQLKELVDTKNKLFSIISHDLRGPIGNFLSVLELLTTEKELDDELKTRFLEQLKKNSKTTLNLLENLLQWSNSQTNKIILKPTYFVINDLIRDNIDLFLSSAKQKEISIKSKIDTKLTVFADIESISLVIRNLLSNAIKFSPKKGEINFFAHQDDKFVTVDVIDTGVGMKKEIADYLFTTTTFYSTYGTNNEKGSGIGLVLCKDFVEKNGGEISVQSQPGEGSKFSFTVPRMI